MADLRKEVQKLEESCVDRATLSKAMESLRQTRRADALTLRESLARVFADVGVELRTPNEKEASDPTVVLEIVRDSLCSLPGIISKAGDYASYVSLGATLAHLRREGCSHYPLLGKKDCVIEEGLVRNPASKEKCIAKRLVMDMWCPCGRVVAWDEVLRHQSHVSFLFPDHGCSL